MRWIIGPLKKYADFGGRASRSEFWAFFLFANLLTYAAHKFEMRSADIVMVALQMGVVELSVWLVVLLPTITVSARRLHDTGRSGWWLMAVYVPFLAWLKTNEGAAFQLVAAGALFVGAIIYIVLMLLPGEPGANAFGEPPS
jgi:uncharacterized membrane protein YhaH (DUF805 family)